MALVQCRNCGKNVSDKAKICPNCGVRLLEDVANEVLVLQEKQLLTCEECGAEISVEAEACPNCGCPIPNNETVNVQKVELSSVNLPKMKHAAKKRIVIGAISLSLIIIISLISINVYNQQREKELAEEAAQISLEYSNNLQSASSMMLMGAGDAENVANLIRNVWYNSIREERDTETDKYTRPNGYFYDDFNDALRELFSDSSFQSEISSIKENQDSVAELMKALRNPPEEHKEAYEAIKEYYDAYLKLTNLAVSPTGSLQTFTDNFNDADTEVLNTYNAIKLYLS